jgi:hypothetical protein
MTAPEPTREFVCWDPSDEGEPTKIRATNARQAAKLNTLRAMADWPACPSVAHCGVIVACYDSGGTDWIDVHVEVTVGIEPAPVGGFDAREELAMVQSVADQGGVTIGRLREQLAKAREQLRLSAKLRVQLRDELRDLRETLASEQRDHRAARDERDAARIKIGALEHERDSMMRQAARHLAHREGTCSPKTTAAALYGATVAARLYPSLSEPDPDPDPEPSINERHAARLCHSLSEPEPEPGWYVETITPEAPISPEEAERFERVIRSWWRSPTRPPWRGGPGLVSWPRPWTVDEQLDMLDAGGDCPRCFSQEIEPQERKRFVLWLNALPEDWTPGSQRDADHETRPRFETILSEWLKETDPPWGGWPRPWHVSHGLLLDADGDAIRGFWSLPPEERADFADFANALPKDWGPGGGS